MGIFILFNGLPFGEIIARNVVNNYLDNQYPNRGFTVSKVYPFNPKNGGYRVLVKSDKSDFGIKYYWITNTVADGNYNVLLSEKFKKDIKGLVQQYSQSIIVAGSILHSQTKVNNLERLDKIDITLKNKTEDFVLTKDQYLILVERILKYLQDNDYNVTQFQLSYLDKNYSKEKSYVLLLDSKQINLPLKEIAKLISKPSGTIWK